MKQETPKSRIDQIDQNALVHPTLTLNALAKNMEKIKQMSNDDFEQLKAVLEWRMFVWKVHHKVWWLISEIRNSVLSNTPRCKADVPQWIELRWWLKRAHQYS